MDIVSVSQRNEMHILIPLESIGLM